MKINERCCNTLIVGAGAAGMNCAVHLHEFMTQNGVRDAADRILVITAGLPLGASRMSGSDKQTYYKLGTSPQVPDSAESFAASLTAGGACHGDLAMAEGVGSLREFYHLVQAGVPFPHDAIGAYVGYKTDHDPYQRATSAGPKTSLFMSQCLERQVRRAGIQIVDHQELVEFISTRGKDGALRIFGVVTLDNRGGGRSLSVYYCQNLVLAAGGPGELYKTSVYPHGQTGCHGVAFRAGLAAENLTESQFGLASVKFRWNVSGTYMQAIPRIFSTDAAGGDEREFLADAFADMPSMANNIFLKGYQWPFDVGRIDGRGSSIIDLLVFNETRRGRRVWMDFRRNPVGAAGMKKFRIADLPAESQDYLRSAGATQAMPIARLAHMNSPAIDIYHEHGIDIRRQPLEIAVCAQHNNGGFAVNKWWESNIPGTFVIGEMAGTHGVKRPGGSALNAGQVGGLRAAEYIANIYGPAVAENLSRKPAVRSQVRKIAQRLQEWDKKKTGIIPSRVIEFIQSLMTEFGGHVRSLAGVRAAIRLAVSVWDGVRKGGFAANGGKLASAVRAEHLLLSAIAYLKAIEQTIVRGGGSRGSYLVLDDRGIAIKPTIIDPTTGKATKRRIENAKLRHKVLRIEYSPKLAELFSAKLVPVRPVPGDSRAFELIWKDFREKGIYGR